MIDSETLSQLQLLEIPGRPLLVCDVDEVILHLVEPFEQLLGESGLVLHKKAVKLNGNIFHQSDGREASQQEIWSALDLLFEEQDKRQNPVDGVAQVLSSLSDQIDIVLLTNLPHKYGDLRRRHLADIGIPYPLVTNSNAKGPALQWLNERWQSELAFVDDTPHHLESVREHTPSAHLIHFMANQEFRTMIGELESVLLSTGDWAEAGKAIHRVLLDKDDG